MIAQNPPRTIHSLDDPLCFKSGDFGEHSSERSVTVSVAFTIGRSLACDLETAAAPEYPKAIGTVALRTTPKILHLVPLSRPRDLF